ncbi:MAG: transcriptional repressor [Clostridia bacterium]|nr:transcriptional repressor [Clostridia bacterium]
MKNKYNTKQREGILNYLKDKQNSNVTAEEIINYFKSNGENIGKATVYRFLNDLVEQKVVKKYMVEGRNCSCYQYIEDHNCDEHFHLKCEKCNKIIHLECEEFKEVQNHISKEHNFELDNVKTIFYGICNDCKKENNIKE